jgi:three-Cys-motif partner protein
MCRRDRALPSVLLAEQPQLPFDVPPERVPKPPLRLVTKHGEQLVLAAGTKSLVGDDQGLLSRVVHVHSRRKAELVRRYCEIVGTGMRFHWPDKLWWVEFYAGPGRLFECDSGEFLRGSPLDALSVTHRLTGYVFIDLDGSCVDSLRARTAEASNVHILHGDANDPNLHDEIAMIVPRNALVVMYADPEGLNFDFDTIRHFNSRYPHVDWLINFPGPGAGRYLAAGYEEHAIRVLDTQNPRDLLSTAGRKTYGATLREVYGRKLAAIGFKCDYEPIFLANGAHIYDVFLATKNPRGLDFFKKAARGKNRQASLLDLLNG